MNKGVIAALAALLIGGVAFMLTQEKPAKEKATAELAADVKIGVLLGFTGPIESLTPDMASGAEFTFMGRSFMYGVGALGNEGGNHTISLIKKELIQVMEQLCCEKTSDFKNHLI